MFYFIISLALLIPTTISIQCLNNPNQIVTRMFEDLQDLQRNMLSFTFGHKKFKGNSVKFKSGDLTFLPKNAFVTFDSDNIIKIALDGKHVAQIQDGAFYQLECLMALDLSNNTISTLTKKTFEGLKSLRELDMSNNAIQDLSEQCFSHLSRLRYLSLANNNLQDLKSDAFFKLWLLEKLDLSNNHLKIISGEALQYLKSLTHLHLHSNEIVELGMEDWKHITNLQVLDVSYNSLDAFDMSIRYSFGRSLMELYLNNNSLTKLFISAIRRSFPALKTINLNDNFWSCEDLLLIVQTLNASQISHVGGSDKIACNRDKALKVERTWDVPVTPIDSIRMPNQTTEEAEPPHDSNESFSAIQTVLLILVIVVFTLVFVGFSYKTRWYRCVRRRGRYIEIERLSLANGRYNI